MLEKKDRGREKSPKEEAEEIKEILSVVSTEIPALIKNIIASVFSEEAGRNMGKAAGAFYKELKDSGMPDNLALQMTEDYMKTFTGLGDLFKQIGSKGSFSPKMHEEIQKRIKDRISEKMKEKGLSSEEEED
ncbi:hypothetical protein KAU88_08725 [Candidatus Bathyarchaeota archaeon]|nr:hypothetical protein [Candidatus Bathyarchaeota archaeon]